MRLFWMEAALDASLQQQATSHRSPRAPGAKTMRFVYYAMTLLFGLLGALGALRSIERLVSGEGVMVVQVLFAAGGFLLARTFLLKARRAGARPTGQGTS